MIRSLKNEIWREIENCEGYFISSKGRLKSVKLVKKFNSEVETLISQYVINGYLTAFAFVKKERKTITIHREVAKAFIPNPECFQFVKHKDLNKTNNKVENLVWMEKKPKSYNHKVGEHHGRAKLTNEQVRSIRQKRLNGEKLIVLAMENNVSIGCISNLMKTTYQN